MNVYVLQVAKALGELGNQVDVYTRRHDPNDPQIIDLGPNARVIHLNAGPYFCTKETLHRHIPEFLDSLRRFQREEGMVYDLIHSHYWLSGVAGDELSREWDIPHATTFHTLARKKMQARVGEKESRLRVTAEPRVMLGADAIVVSTEQESEDLARLYGTPPLKVRVIPAGVDLDLFRPVDKARARQSLGLTEKQVVLSVGRIEPLKGLDTLIGAFAMLDAPADSRLLVVGGTPGRDREIDRLRSISERLGVQDNVSFVGAVDQAELPTYFSAADVFVLPSHYESFGLVALEAMACGLPVVASRVGGPRAIIKDGRTGYLIPWHCPEPFAQRIDILLANPALRESMGRAAMASAQTMGWSRVAGRMTELYDSLIGQTWQNAAGA
jgi:D-inositol-3-phosphate glycosyltransferase